jgi:coenzyme F420 hydrogenase subunit beta
MMSVVGPAVKGIRDVGEKHLCLGCGTCAYMQPGAISMVDVPDQGRRPVVRADAEGCDLDTSDALAACPGVALAHDSRSPAPEHIADLFDEWGPVLEVWEGYASDDELRLAGSSGGAASALALHCLEAEGMYGVLHVAARPDVAYLNHTVLSRTRGEMLAATGSRYAPASPCDGLALIEAAPGPCVFIGKPCDAAGLAKARARRPALDDNVGAVIAMFCAGTPSTNGTLEMMRRMGVQDVANVESVRYRGNGWPGVAEVRERVNGSVVHRTLTYAESWGDILQKHRPWRCSLCPDHTGEFADVAVGDPWYREIPDGELGRSLVLVRTERGRRLVRAAMDGGALTLQRADPGILPASQPNLLKARGAVWGRVATSRSLGLATPRFGNMPMFGTWWSVLTWKQKAQSVYGTAKRIRSRQLYRRRPYQVTRAS